VCLSGQHTISALQNLRMKFMENHPNIPAWMTTVKARVVYHDPEI